MHKLFDAGSLFKKKKKKISVVGTHRNIELLFLNQLDWGYTGRKSFLHFVFFLLLKKFIHPENNDTFKFLSLLTSKYELTYKIFVVVSQSSIISKIYSLKYSWVWLCSVQKNYFHQQKYFNAKRRHFGWMIYSLLLS